MHAVSMDVHDLSHILLQSCVHWGVSMGSVQIEIRVHVMMAGQEPRVTQNNSVRLTKCNMFSVKQCWKIFSMEGAQCKVIDFSVLS